MKILIGNLFESEKKTLVNTVNCVGVMGKGIALEFKKRYPDMYKEYQELCRHNAVKPGQPYLYRDLTGASILVFPTKDHWRTTSKLEYVINGLDWFVNHYESLKIDSIAFPPLGCGNGGLKWEDVGPIMYQKLSKLPIDIEIYAPYGTKTDMLKAEYLSVNTGKRMADITGKKPEFFNDRWPMILEVIREVNQKKHTLHVGRVIFQKICYMLTRSGISTGLLFERNWYGPYSEQVKDVSLAFSNSNWMTEKQSPDSRMIEITVTPDFSFQRSNYTAKELEIMESCEDLFCRIKNTHQAEMITTVIFEYDELLKRKERVSEQEIYEGVMKWKQWWKDKLDNEVKSTIRDLAMIGQIDPIPSFQANAIVF